MKARVESSGVHLYDRQTGLHVLLDDEPDKDLQPSLAPSLVSVALLNACDLRCRFCYAPKHVAGLDKEVLLMWCRELDCNGTLEVAFGGGEPTLYSGLDTLCQTIWSETRLGISITTHGHHLTPQLIDGLAECISIVRISIDACEPLYSRIRGRPLEPLLGRLEYARGRLPFAVNTVVNSESLEGLRDLAQVVCQSGATDWLLLPETMNGKYVLTDEEWTCLRGVISEWEKRISIRIPRHSIDEVSVPVLFRSIGERDYAHITADGYISTCSYLRDGPEIDHDGVIAAYERLRHSHLGG